MDNSKGVKEVWHVVFTGVSYKHWLLDKLMPGFQHVYCMKLSRGGQYWAVIDGKRSHLHVQIEPVELYPTARDYAGPDATIVTAKTTIQPRLPNHWLSVITCTDIVKRCLGVTDFTCFTPYQLYKRLMGGRYDQRIKAWRRGGKTSSSTPARSTRETKED